MKRFRALMKAHPEYWYVLFVPAYLLCFFLVEHLVPAGADYWVSYLPLDDHIPFVEVFAVPYCLWYPLLMGVGLGLMFLDVPEFKKYMWFLILGFGFSLLFCLAFPNGQDLRPLPFPRDNLFTRLLGRVYAADTNTNVLPSMHVIGCTAACCGVWRTHSRVRRWRWPVTVLSLLTCAATVLVKQHSILDVFVGFAVCVPIWFVLYYKKKTGTSD